MFTNLKNLFRDFFCHKNAGRKRKPNGQISKPLLEELENRIAPAIWYVTTLANEGPGSLRDILTGQQLQAGSPIQANDTVILQVPTPLLPRNAPPSAYNGTIQLQSPITCSTSVTIEQGDTGEVPNPRGRPGYIVIRSI
jgi:hypothetical protein